MSARRRWLCLALSAATCLLGACHGQPESATFTWQAPTGKWTVDAADGKQDVSGSGIGADASLANTAPLFVGGTPQGRCLAGAFDFARISLGTLADAKTTIEELYAWQFDGPFLRDFCGATPSGRRAAGAIATTP